MNFINKWANSPELSTADAIKAWTIAGIVSVSIGIIAFYAGMRTDKELVVVITMSVIATRWAMGRHYLRKAEEHS